eukprot:snap_masked-scaffold_2-processed-gene-13.17-mRNA-1 protein AED:1.00 eAED:1.00 QI:0/-1/0/0/-1/1/1/0/376
MLSKTTEEFGNKLFERGALIDADFKPVSSWTRQERNEYAKRAMKKYRVALKEKENQLTVYSQNLKTEIVQLKKEISSLKLMLNKLGKRNRNIATCWDDSFLLKQNEVLRKETVKLKSAIYIEKKFSRLKQYFPLFDVQKFLPYLKESIIGAINLIEETNSREVVFKKKLRREHSKRKIKKELNERIKRERSKFGKMSIKSVSFDTKRKHVGTYKVDVQDEDFVEFTDVMYNVLKLEAYNDYIQENFDIDRDICDFDSTKVLFYCPEELKNVHFDHQAIKLSIFTPKFDAPIFVVVSALYRNSEFALILKSSLYFDENEKSFQVNKTGSTSCLVSKYKTDKKKLFAKSCCTFPSEDNLSLFLSYYKYVKLKLKMNNF